MIMTLGAYWGTVPVAGTWQHVLTGFWLLAGVIAFLMLYDTARSIVRDRRRRRR